jgi:branched-chain amino acid transport system substrate-binding protein
LRLAEPHKNAVVPALVALCLVCAASLSLVAARAAGIANDEIVIGTHLDLSGPLAPWGKAVRNAMQMAIGEANAAGGVNGRKIRIVVKDDGYNPGKAAAAVRALVDEDRVFAVVSPLGTPTVQAAAREATENGTLYLFPITSGDEHPLGFSPLLFTLTPPTKRAVTDGLRRLLELRGASKIAILTSDDAYGWSIRTAAEDELSRRKLKPVNALTFAHGKEPDAGLRKLYRDRPAVVVLGMIPDDALSVLRAADRLDWHPVFLCPACYTPEFAALAGEMADRTYSIGHMPLPYPDASGIGAWAKRYSRKYRTVASPQALAAYRNTRLFITALRRAGRTPTNESFTHVLETQGPWADPDLGVPPVLFSEDSHLGLRASFLETVKKGRWETVPDDRFLPAGSALGLRR